jgi:hypothetical protein
MQERPLPSSEAMQLKSGHPPLTPVKRDVEHSHGGRGTWIDSVTIGEERTHFHRTATGMSSPAPNRPGHTHRLPNGSWTQPSLERWSSAGIGRL